MIVITNHEFHQNPSVFLRSESNILSKGRKTGQKLTKQKHNASGAGRRRFWHATHDCVAPYVDIILHRGRF